MGICLDTTQKSTLLISKTNQSNTRKKPETWVHNLIWVVILSATNHLRSCCWLYFFETFPIKTFLIYLATSSTLMSSHTIIFTKALLFLTTFSFFKFFVLTHNHDSSPFVTLAIAPKSQPLPRNPKPQKKSRVFFTPPKPMIRIETFHLWENISLTTKDKWKGNKHPCEKLIKILIIAIN